MAIILTVEDDIQISNMIKLILESKGYQVVCAYSGSEALLYLQNYQVDLVLLDMMLPGMNGKEVLDAYQNEKNIPFIMLTALNDRQLTVDMLRKGANDYIVKPFDNEELVARIEVQLRKKKEIPQNYLSYLDLHINLDTYQVIVNHQKIMLPKIEFTILKLLLENPNKVFSKEVLYERVWKDVYAEDVNTVHVHISNLRKKLKEANPDQEYIVTVWGIGFTLHK